MGTQWGLKSARPPRAEPQSGLPQTNWTSVLPKSSTLLANETSQTCVSGGVVSGPFADELSKTIQTKQKKTIEVERRGGILILCVHNGKTGTPAEDGIFEARVRPLL